MRLIVALATAMLLVAWPVSSDTQTCTDESEDTCYQQSSGDEDHHHCNDDPSYAGSNIVRAEDDMTGLDAATGGYEGCYQMWWFNGDVRGVFADVEHDAASATVHWYEADDMPGWKDGCYIIIDINGEDGDDVYYSEVACPADQAPPHAPWGDIHPDF